MTVLWYLVASVLSDAGSSDRSDVCWGPRPSHRRFQFPRDFYTMFAVSHYVGVRIPLARSGKLAWSNTPLRASGESIRVRRRWKNEGCWEVLRKPRPQRLLCWVGP